MSTTWEDLNREMEDITTPDTGRAVYPAFDPATGEVLPAPVAVSVNPRAGAWHQSSLALIGNCSWRYFLNFVAGLPDPDGEAARLGIAVHSVVEAHERARMTDGTLTPLDASLDAVTALLGDTAEADGARAAIRNWYTAPAADGIPHREWLGRLTPLALEPYFKLPFVTGAMPIGGWMDAVYQDEAGRVMIVDLKTTGTMSRWKDNGEGKRLQATMYAVAVQVGDWLGTACDYLPEVTYTVVRTKDGKGTRGLTAKRVVVQPDLEDVRVLGDTIREAQRIVDEQDYKTNPAWYLCSKKWCPYYTGCQITGELQGPVDVVLGRLGVAQ